MDTYGIIKTLHILSAMVLFGTGLGIAFFFWMGVRSAEPRAAYFAATTTVIADLLFTLTTVIAQPLTGSWLISNGGFDPLERWLTVSYALYVIAGLCWIPVVFLQIAMRQQLAAKVAGQPFDEALFRNRFRWWFALGWPAFIGLIVIVHLMVTKPA